MILKSRFVVPVGAPVIKNGAVSVMDGHIVEVGSAREIRGGQTIDYGDAVICPGFVNAHTHLELTHLAGRIPPSTDFTGWLAGLVAAVADPSTTKNVIENAVRQGLEQSLASGVTTIGDITSMPAWTRPILAESNARGVSYGEVIAIGSRRHLLNERLGAAVSSEHACDRLRIGISPHSPYTVEPDGMIACAQRAREHASPMCIHLAETADEDAFTRSLKGPLTDHLRNLGIWDENIPIAGCGSVELAARTRVLSPQTLVAHANYVSDTDIALIADSGASVAYCPRTHHAFGHDPHRFRDMLVAGINVCVGTDSLASNPSLSVLDELRFMHRVHPDVDSETLMSMGTVHGARALGFAESAGSIAVGHPADLVVIRLDRVGPTNRWDNILDSSHPPIEVYAFGKPQVHATTSRTH